MEGIKTNQHVLALVAIIIGCWLVISVKGQNSQINTPCTSSMMTTLTPCMNYITGSRPGGSTGASITECCGAFTSLMSNSMDCACLLVTASVPLPLSLSIPKICNAPLSLQCKASRTPLPAPGPVQFATPPPNQRFGAPSPSSQFETPSPASSLGPQAPKPTASTPAAGPTAASTSAAKPAATVAAPAPAVKPTATTAAPTAAAEPTATTAASAPVQEKEPSTPRVHPVLKPSASSSCQSMVSLPTIGLTLIALLMFCL